MFLPVEANDVRFCKGVVPSPVAGATPSCWLMSVVVDAAVAAGGCSAIMIAYVVLLL